MRPVQLLEKKKGERKALAGLPRHSALPTIRPDTFDLLLWHHSWCSLARLSPPFRILSPACLHAQVGIVARLQQPSDVLPDRYCGPRSTIVPPSVRLQTGTIADPST